MDGLDRLNAELLRCVAALIEALKAIAVAEASRDADAISQARETVWQARLALAELAFGDELRERMDQEIAPLDNQGDDPEIEHRRMLMGLGRFMQDLRSIGSAKLSDLTAGDALIMLDGKPGRVLRPVEPGSKAYDKIDLHLMRRCVLRVFVECARTGAKNMDEFLRSLRHAPAYDRFRGWSQRVPSEEREMATEIGEALRTGQPLSVDQAALWDGIKDGDLDEMFGYLLRLTPP